MANARMDARTMLIAGCNHLTPLNVMMVDVSSALRTITAQAIRPAMTVPIYARNPRCAKRVLIAFLVGRVSMAPVRVIQSVQRRRAMPTVFASRVVDNVCQTHRGRAKTTRIAPRLLYASAKETGLGVVDVTKMPSVVQTEPVSHRDSVA